MRQGIARALQWLAARIDDRPASDTRNATANVSVLAPNGGAFHAAMTAMSDGEAAAAVERVWRRRTMADQRRGGFAR